MNARVFIYVRGVTCAVLVIALWTDAAALADLFLGPAEVVQADGADIAVPGYSVPSWVDWNNDGLNDLIVGEGGGGYDARVRVYLNVGTIDEPQFSAYAYAQSEGADLVLPGGGCQGAYPRVVYWDEDDRKDLLVGMYDGRIDLFLNNGTDESPTFDAGTILQVGEPGSKTDIDVGARANSVVVDWNNDGRRDLVVGALDGRVNVFINEGTDREPDFRTVQYAQADGADLVVPAVRASPVVMDLDDDGRKDLLSGNTEGNLVFYSNVGTDDAPTFSGFALVEADGVPIDLDGTPRSRPFVCDWTGDGRLDVLVGAGDGLVRLYRGACRADLDGSGDVGQPDLSILLGDWGCSGGDCPGDCDGDGDTDHADLGILLANWGCGS